MDSKKNNKEVGITSVAFENIHTIRNTAQCGRLPKIF